MTQAFAQFVLALVAKWLTGISAADWERVKNLVREYEDKVLPNTTKHGQVAEFVHTVVHTTSETTIDFLIKMALLWARKEATK